MNEWCGQVCNKLSSLHRKWLQYCALAVPANNHSFLSAGWYSMPIHLVAFQGKSLLFIEMLLWIKLSIRMWV